MFAGEAARVFGPRGGGRRRGRAAAVGDVGVVRGGGRARWWSCAVVVNTRGPLDTAGWFEVWAGAGAGAAMCVRRGLVGIGTGQGEFVGHTPVLWSGMVLRRG